MNSKNILLLLSCVALGGCAGVAAGTGVAVGTAAVQEGGISRATSDALIQTQINDLWFRHSVNMFTKLDLTINQGRVLITGVVQDPQHRVEAVRLAWKPSGVKQVINEITVSDSDGVVGYAKDSWIGTRLRSALIFDRDIESINYSIDVVQGTVFLMGFAQDQRELDRTIDIARNIPNVTRVASYVKLVGEPEAPAQQSALGDGSSLDTTRQSSGSATGGPIEWSQDSVY